MTGRVSRRLILAIAVLCLTPAVALTTAAPAGAAVRYKPCKLSVAEQESPGGTSAFELTVTASATSCTMAKRVMTAFHRCRTESRVGCATKVLKTWRCSGRRLASSPREFLASFDCARGKGRIKSTYWQETPACFGAAARDPKLRCSNTSRTVYPSQHEDDPEQTWQCAPQTKENACMSGVEAKAATRHVALVGDSHSMHWRSPLNAVAAIRQWRVYSHFNGGCFYSTEAVHFTDGCGEFYNNTAAWFAQHPEVSTVFITANADTPIGVPPGQDQTEVKIAGFMRAFQTLPKSVEHIIVLRDTTRSSPETLSCAFAAIDSGTQRLAPLCPLARSYALRPDLAVTAVQRLKSTRYQYVDLSDFMCSAADCYPVVGGTLVNGDQFGHLRMTFSRTLSPYLMRGIRRLEASW